MRRRPTLFAVTGAIAVVATLGIASALLGTSGCVCNCELTPGNAQLRVPASRGLALVGVVANGPTCHAMVGCTRFPIDGGFAVECSITADREGTCRVEATFNDNGEVFTRDVVFRAVGGCCPALVPDPAGLDVPPLDANDPGVDAGDDASSE